MSDLYEFIFELQKRNFATLEGLPDDSRMDDILDCHEDCGKSIVYYTYEDIIQALDNGVLPIHCVPYSEQDEDFYKVSIEIFRNMQMPLSRFVIVSMNSILLYLTEADKSYLTETAQTRWAELSSGITVTSDYRVLEEMDLDSDLEVREDFP
jgi:hypothetical protein